MKTHGAALLVPGGIKTDGTRTGVGVRISQILPELCGPRAWSEQHPKTSSGGVSPHTWAEELGVTNTGVSVPGCPL